MVLLNDYGCNNRSFISTSYHKTSCTDYHKTKYAAAQCAASAEDRINKILIEFYARLYNEVIISINEFLSLVKENDVNKLIEIFTAEYFACLVTKIYAIKIDLTKEFEDYNPFPVSVTLFINNFINTLFMIVDTFKHIIEIMKDNKRFSLSHEILQSLDAIREYVNEHFNDANSSTIEITATSTIGIKLIEPYNTYYNRYGFDSGPIDPERLAAIQYELEQNQTSDT